MLEELKKCQLCERDVTKLRKHHLVPKQKGGRHGGTIFVCATCIDMIHQLFTNYELANEYNTLEKLKNSPRMRKYLSWVKDRPNERYTVAKKKKRRRKRGK